MATRERYFNSARQMLQLCNDNGDMALMVQFKPYPDMAHIIAMNMAIVPMDVKYGDQTLRRERWDDAVCVSLDIVQLMYMLHVFHKPKSQRFHFDNNDMEIKTMSVESSADGKVVIFLNEMDDVIFLML